MALAMVDPMSEDDEHKRFAARLMRSDLIWCHVPNGELRDKRTAAKLKLMGVKPGVPDFLFFTEPRTAIEMKRADGKGRLSKEQKAWRDSLEGCGWKWFCCEGEAAALEIIKKVYGCDLKPKKLDPKLFAKRTAR